MKELQSEHWSFAEFSQSSKISVWPISCSYFCDASLNLLIFCLWLISLWNCSLSWCDSNFSINLDTVCRLCSSCCWTVESDMPGTLWSTMLHPVSRKLCASICVSQDDLASCLGRSCNLHCEFALRTTRGLALSLRWSCSLVFMHVALSMNSAGSVLWRTTALDLVW